MRVVFAGTQSVGKTTLVEDLTARIVGARTEEEPIRAVARATGEPPPPVPTSAPPALRAARAPPARPRPPNAAPALTRLAMVR